MDMPLYDYRCVACNNVSELRHGFDEQAGPCPSCGGTLTRQFHAAPIIFNGSGFYVTDSRPRSGGSSEKPLEKTEKPSEKTPEKPAEKPASDAASSVKKEAAA
jgi:putative FmdB family regulatory protein